MLFKGKFCVTLMAFSWETTYVHSNQNDIIQKCIGILGPWHIWVCLAIFLVKFPIAWHQLSIVFLAPPVTFSCVDNTTSQCSSNCSSHIFDRSIFTETIATQWDLVCEKQHLTNLAQTITMLGILFGNMLFGYLSDRFGRKNPMVIAVLIQAVSGLASAFSPWFSLFMVMRFLAALATGGTMVMSFVLIMELVGTEWRTVLGILYQIPFNLGHLTMPLIAYYLRDWRYFQIAISAPSIILISYYWILPESPRWLLAAGEKDKAISIMEKAARANKLATRSVRDNVELHLKAKSTEVESQSRGNILDLVRTRIMRIYTFSICFNWIVCGLCFFGVAQFIGQLAGNIFINVALSAVIQIPGSLFACWSTKSWGRKKTLIFGNLVAGLSMVVIGASPEEPTWIRTTFSTSGMFGLAVSFPTVYIYSGELFPTIVRNIGVGTCSMSARIGSMLSPFVASLVTVQPWLPPVIFGTVPIIGAFLCFFLPETLDCKLPDTIEEAEQFAKQNKPNETELT